MILEKLEKVFVRRNRTYGHILDDYLVICGLNQYYQIQRYGPNDFDYWHLRYYYNGNVILWYSCDHRNNYICKRIISYLPTKYVCNQKKDN